MRQFFKICFLLCALRTPVVGSAQSYTPAAANLAARKEFQDDKFGMFIHWGASSVLGSGEWVMNNRNIKVSDYKHLVQFFNPQQFDAAKWVAIAKSAQRNNLAEEIPNINVPTLLVWGLNDTITPPMVAHEFNRLIPRSSLKFIDKCCHAPMMEHPEKFNELVEDFLLN